MRQHYIPNFHLRAFGAPKNGNMSNYSVGLATVRKDGTLVRSGAAGTDYIAIENDLYESSLHYPLALEKRLARMEGEGAVPFPTIINGVPDNNVITIPGTVSTALGKYLFALYLRQPSQLGSAANNRYLADVMRTNETNVSPADLFGVLGLLTSRRMSINIETAIVTHTIIPTILPIENPILMMNNNTLTVALSPRLIFTATFKISPFIRNKPLAISYAEDDGSAVKNYLGNALTDDHFRNYVYALEDEEMALDVITKVVLKSLV